MEKSYAGNIKNQGAQFVQAPINGSEPKKGTQKVTGTDLRSGTKSEK